MENSEAGGKRLAIKAANETHEDKSAPGSIPMGAEGEPAEVSILEAGLPKPGVETASAAQPDSTADDRTAVPINGVAPSELEGGVRAEGRAMRWLHAIARSDKMFGLFIFTMLVACGALVKVHFESKENDYSWEAMVDIAAGFLLLLGTIWVAKGVALKGSVAADWKERLRNNTDFAAKELAGALVEASDYGFQGILVIYVGSVLAIAKPFIAKHESEERARLTNEQKSSLQACSVSLISGGQSYVFAGTKDPKEKEPAGSTSLCHISSVSTRRLLTTKNANSTVKAKDPAISVQEKATPSPKTRRLSKRAHSTRAAQ